MVYASLVLEREPLRWEDMPSALAHWVQDAGIVAALGLTVWLIAYWARYLAAAGQGQFARPPRAPWAVAAAVASLICYALFGVLLLVQGKVFGSYTTLQSVALTAAGAIALIAVVSPPVFALVGRIRARRVWAMAWLSIKEAVRGRVLYVFALMALVFLFAGYFVPYKAEYQIRNYVTVIFLPLTLVFVVLAALLGAFSIPRDVVKQTIHTIVTKPVERYEIVLGRFLGNAALLTVGLFVLTAVSLLYVARGVTAEAAEESYKARVPVEPDRLTFSGTGKEDRGESVGREWDYRSYIRGRTPELAGRPRQYAVWSFGGVPAALAERQEPVLFEYTFDIFRTSKAEAGKEGVFCTLTFADGRLSLAEVERRARAAERERPDLLRRAAKAAAPDAADDAKRKVEDQLVRKHGVYVADGLLIVDYHTGKLTVPASLFQKVREERAGGGTAQPGEPDAPDLKVYLSVGDDRKSAEQLVGVAKRDLYLLAGELPFWQNFFKGAVGLWLLVLLVLGISLACSTYLSGIISLLCTFFLVGSGLLIDYVRELASGRAEGGGPVQAGWRIFNHLPIGMSLDESPVAALGQGIDTFYSWVLRYVLKVIPDVNRFNLTEYVASGFDISWTRVLLLDNVVPLVGYLLPWAVLAYYLMRSREIANPS
jgi:ABC-type transport system involved in multi-copper enzyme maturation permease subunit